MGATLGAVGGALVGLIFPPSLLASAVVGARSAGAPAASSTTSQEGDQGRGRAGHAAQQLAIVAVFEERWVAEVEKALAKADKVTKERSTPTASRS